MGGALLFFPGVGGGCYSFTSITAPEGLSVLQRLRVVTTKRCRPFTPFCLGRANEVSPVMPTTASERVRSTGSLPPQR